MRAVVKLLYPDDYEITMVLSEAEVPDSPNDTLGSLINRVVQDALAMRLTMVISVSLSRDTEDTPA